MRPAWNVREASQVTSGRRGCFSSSLVILSHKSPWTCYRVPSLQRHDGHFIYHQPLYPSCAHFVALPMLPSSKEMADLLVNNFFRLHRLPLEVMSDKSPQFTSHFRKDFCSLFGANVIRIPPQSNGQTEQLYQELEKSLRCIVERSPTSWAESLPWVEYVHNLLLVSSTGLSKFACCLIYQPPLFPEEEGEFEVPVVQLLLQHAHRTWRV